MFVINKSNGLKVVVTGFGAQGAVLAEVYDRRGNRLTTRELNPAERALFAARKPGETSAKMNANRRLNNYGRIERPAPSSRSGRGGRNVVPFAVRQESVYAFFRRRGCA